MTNHDAKEWITIMHNVAIQIIDNPSFTEATKIAVESLKEQPCEDCISREATIDAIYKKHIGGKDAIENAPINDLYACGLEEAIDAVENMPSVQPQPKKMHQPS